MQFGSITPYLSDAKSVISGTARPAIDKIRGYGQKLSDAVNPTLYHKPSHFGKSFAKPVILAGSVYGAMNLVSDSMNKNLAHAAYDEFGNYRCPDDSDAFGSGFNRVTAKMIAEDEYWLKVKGFNTGVESSSGSIEDINKSYITGSDLDKGSDVDDLGKMAGCLYEKHNVEPDSVIMFSEKAQAVLSYDMEKLVQVAPELVDYATVSEGIVGKGLAIGMISAISLLSPRVREVAYKAGINAKSILENLFKHT